MTRRYAAPRELVFAVLSQAEHMQHWMCPAEVTVPGTESDLRVGGRYRMQMKSPDGQLFIVGGVYLLIESPKRLIFTRMWEPEHTMAGIETTVTIELTAQGNETLLTMTHVGLPNAEERASHEAAWTGAYDSLRVLLARLVLA
jgi:uncharacterized protein YndB with AHSA1/START domain